MIPVAYHMLKAISVLQARLASRTTISASALEPCLKMSAWAGDIQTALDTLMAKPEEENVSIDVDVWRQQLPIKGLQCCLMELRSNCLFVMHGHLILNGPNSHI